MQAEELLSVTPEDLVVAILERRKAAAASLPKILQQRTEENDRAHRLASEARAEVKRLEELEQGDESQQDVLKKARTMHEEHEAFRRRTASRLQTVKNAIADGEEAIQFWSELVKGGWGHLLEDAERLASGGASSYAVEKQRKLNREGN